MTGKMLFEIENFGPISNANIEIDNVTVIVGKNGTGKSTSSKFLFSLLTANSPEGINLANCDIKSRFRDLINLMKLHEDELNDLNQLLEQDLSNELFEGVYENLEEAIVKIDSTDVRNLYMERLSRIRPLIEINKDSTARYIRIVNSILDSEFGYSLKNQESIRLNFKGSIEDEELIQEIFIKDESNQKISQQYFDYFNFENVVYIDSLSILESLWAVGKPDGCIDGEIPFHLQLLIQKLKNANNGNVYDEEYYRKLIDFKAKVDKMIGGNFAYDVSNDKFIFKSGGNEYPMENTASGLKQLGIIQLLLDNRELTEDSFLIIDEPEVNLHPEFQVKLAEILVLASKELNITLYVNTHSPFLAEAVEVYSRHYDFFDGVKFYLTQEAEGSDKFDYEKVDEENVMDVYDNLGNPFELLNKVRFQTELR